MVYLATSHVSRIVGAEMPGIPHLVLSKLCQARKRDLDGNSSSSRSPIQNDLGILSPPHQIPKIYSISDKVDTKLNHPKNITTGPRMEVRTM